MTGVQLMALSAINRNSGESIMVMLPLRSFVTVGIETEKFASGDIAEIGKTYSIIAQLPLDAINMVKSWAKHLHDVWVSGFSKDGMILQSRGHIKVDGDRMVIERPCVGGYSEDGMHTAGMSLCRNAFAISKWDGHDGYVFFPFNRDITISHEGTKPFLIHELNEMMEVIMSHKVYDRVHFSPRNETMFLYIGDDYRKSVRKPMMSLGKNMVKYEDFNI